MAAAYPKTATLPASISREQALDNSAECESAPVMENVEQSLYWPEAMLVEMQQHGARLDKSLSWCAQKAWLLSRDQLRSQSAQASDTQAEATWARYETTGEGPTNKTRQAVVFPADMLSEIQKEAQRRDRSLSWLMQRAWCIAVADIAKLSRGAI